MYFATLRFLIIVLLLCGRFAFGQSFRFGRMGWLPITKTSVQFEIDLQFAAPGEVLPRVGDVLPGPGVENVSGSFLRQTPAGWRLGSRVRQYKKDAALRLDLQLAGLPPGTYVLHMREGDCQTVRRFIQQ